jgi:transcriptional pleiotropic regulator of transition state genes
MKSTGIVRQMDDLGRIVIPVELRRTLQIDRRDPLEIFVEGDKIILRKYEAACIFCGSAEDVVTFKDKTVCSHCLSQMSHAS